jgi:hypothetical protein
MDYAQISTSKILLKVSQVPQPKDTITNSNYTSTPSSDLPRKLKNFAKIGQTFSTYLHLNYHVSEIHSLKNGIKP